MDKKEQLLILLNELKDIWPESSWLVLLVKHSDFDNDLVLSLLDIINKSLNSSFSELQVSKFKNIKTFLESIKSEELEQKPTQKELDNLFFNI